MLLVKKQFKTALLNAAFATLIFSSCGHKEESK